MRGVLLPSLLMHGLVRLPIQAKVQAVESRQTYCCMGEHSLVKEVVEDLLVLIISELGITFYDQAVYDCTSLTQKSS